MIAFPVFEPEGEKEHEAEYKKIHEDYKNLVHIKITVNYQKCNNSNKSNGYDTVKVSHRVANIFMSQADFEVMFETTQSFCFLFDF